MTSPPPGQDPYQPPDPPGYPVPQPPQPPQPGYPGQLGYPVVPYQPVSGPPQPYPQPMSPYPAAYGVDPATGLPLSDKSKVVAGLLQLLPGFFVGLGGVGRLYAGNTGLGVAQICLTVVGWVSFWCGFFLLFPFVIYFGLWAWYVVDGIVMLAGRPTDGQGRLLRS